MITIFSKEEEKYFLTFVLKYDNDFETILGEMKKGAKINYKEVEKYMKNVEEKYVILFSNDYPEYFRNFSQPPFALFYEGNLELFNNNGATFENPLDSTKDFYLAVSEDGGNEVDWCIAVTHEEDLLPVVNKFLNDLEEDLDFKKYANKNELNLS